MAGELERQWNEALAQVTQAEENLTRLQHQPTATLTAEKEAQIRALAQDLPALWQTPQTTYADRKRLLRVLLVDVLLVEEKESGRVRLTLHGPTEPVTKTAVFRPVARYADRADWSFHGPPFPELALEGVDFPPPQEKGTRAGPDVPFGQFPLENPTSGFQSLFNVQRGAPAGGWSALGSLPEEDLHRKMTLLPACAQEVIVADAEPELRPENPATLKYVLARNRGEDLDRCYAVVIEPYRDAPRLERIEPLAVVSLETPGAVDVVGFKLRYGEGTDYVLSALSGEAAVTMEKDLELGGELGFVSKDADGVRTLFLANGTRLRCGDTFRVPSLAYFSRNEPGPASVQETYRATVSGPAAGI